MFIFIHASVVNAQSGQWTWMHGSPVDNQLGVFGTKGVSSPFNVPPGLYEASNWTDLNGNFWVFGGGGFSPGQSVDYPGNLWMFSPTSNEWTWVNGPGYNGSAAPSVVGLGIAAPSNHPGATTLGAITWVDNNNNLWLFGGIQNCVNGGTGRSNDLWKYDISTNMWTWVKGSGLPNDDGVDGVLGVPDPANLPEARCEATVGWKDCNGNLWMMGGQNQQGPMNDVWRYNISTNEWTRIEGTTAGNPIPGTTTNLGIESPTSLPGTRQSYASWNDTCNSVYLFGGNYIFNPLGDTWRFNLDTEDWTWLGGGVGFWIWGDYGQMGVPACTNRPPNRIENKAAWIDNCGNFWMFGGFHIGFPGNIMYRSMNDLWMYDPRVNVWTWIDGDSSFTAPTHHYGIQGVSDSLNQPREREGAVSFTDLDGNLWLFGGLYRSGPPTDYHYLNDMWKYVPDSVCVALDTGVVSSFTASPLSGCDSLEVNFTNTGSNSVFLWDFGDSTNSGEQNPTHHYTSSGTYTVSLTTWGNCLSGDVDSFTVVDLITVNSSTSIDSVVACDSYTWIDGITYTSSVDTPVYVINPGTACDSLLALNLTINQSSSSTDQIIACDEFTWIDGNTYTSSTNTPTWVLTNMHGCDSIVTLDLTINSTQAVVTQINEVTLQAGPAGAQYQWLMCDDAGGFTEIWDEIDQEFTIPQIGSYAVIVTQSGCPDTSACFDAASFDIVENGLGEDFAVYPNPTQQEVNVLLGKQYKLVSIDITDVSGRTVQVHSFQNVDRFVIDIEGEPGVYFLSITASNDKKALVRVLKE